MAATLVTLAVTALRNASRQRRDVRHVLAFRREGIEFPILDELELFSADEIAALTVSPHRAKVRLTRYPDPWARDFNVPPHLLPIYANKLRVKFHTWTIGIDLAVLLFGAVISVAVGDIVRDFTDGADLRTSTTVLLVVGVFAIIAVAQIRITIVAGWKSAADRYRQLTLQSRQHITPRPVGTPTTVPALDDAVLSD